MNELVEVPKENALQVFSTTNGLDPYLQKIRDELDGFTPDISTLKGRKEIASMAHRVAKSKTALDSIGKDLVAEQKAKIKVVDAERKRMRDTLDKWKVEVRAPLTEFEEREEARIASHKAGIETIKGRLVNAAELDSSALKDLIAVTQDTVIDDRWEEFEAEAARAKLSTLDELNALLDKRLGYEAEQAELERLRAEKEERERKEREERIAREAAERAQREYEEQAAKEKAEAEAKAKAEREAAERRELELKLAAERAEREKLEAEERAKQAAIEAEERAKRQAEEARRKEEEETKRREADRKHRAKINNAAVAALVSAELVTENAAKAIVTLIAKGEVPNVKIHY